MTLRDHRLTAAARTWGRAQLAAETAKDAKDRRDWLARQIDKTKRRAKRAGSKGRAR
jgi:hypothetical protein